MARQGETIVNQVSGERITFLETAGGLLRLEWSLEPDGFLAGAHAHPRQKERFEVLSGTLGMRVGRRKYRLGAGDAIVSLLAPLARYPKYSDRQTLTHPAT